MANKYLNRTVEAVNALLDKLDALYNKSQLDDMFDLKLDKSSVDSALSGTSTNPVQNKVVKAALDTKLTENDVSALRTTVAVNTTDILKNSQALAEIVDSGAKNLLNPASAVDYVGQSSYPITKSGITYTLDTNSETIALSNTASGVSTLRIPITLSAGTYHVSGIPSGGSDSSYRADLRNAGGNTFITSDFDYGSGFTFTLAETTAIDYCIRVASGYSPQNVVVSPMICLKSLWDISTKFVKYRPNYDEIIARIEALESGNTRSVANSSSLSKSTKTVPDI